MTKWRTMVALLAVAATGLAACSSSSDAGGGAGLVGQTLGAVCSTSRDCAHGLTCDDSSVPTATMCSTRCETEADCTHEFGPNSFCIGANRCVVACRSDGDCPSDHVCNDAKWCVRKTCNSDSQCWSYRCDTATQRCKTGCASNADCQAGHVCGLEITPGICYRPSP